MTADPYRVLGVAPDADDSTIRAAYRRQMKRFHPDQNRSEGAAEQAREVAAAYALLCDPDQRSRHDRERRFRAQVIASAPPPPPPPAPRARAGGLLMVALSVGIIGFGLSRIDPGPTPTSPAGPPSRQEATGADQVASVLAPPADAPTATPPAALAEAAQVPVPLPLPLPRTETETETASPPLRAPLTANSADKAAEPAASRAEAPRQPQPRSAQAAPIRVAAATILPTPQLAAEDCNAAATCARIDLVALERMQSLLYNQSYLSAPSAKQARLLQTRATFLARLGRCASAACKRDAYLDRNREVADLMRN